MALGNFIVQNQTGIEERLATAIDISAQVEDPVFRNMNLSTTGVEVAEVSNFSSMSRGYLVHRLFTDGTGGVVEPMQARNDVSLFGDPLTQNFGTGLLRTNVSQGPPDPFGATIPVPFRFTVPMRGLDLNIGFTRAEMRLDNTPANRAEVLGRRMAGWAKLVAQTLTNLWYTSQADNFKIADLGPGTGTGAYTIDATNRRITFYPSNEAIYRFNVKGMAVDICRVISNTVVRMNDSVNTATPAAADAATQTPLTRVAVVVLSCDPASNKVVLQANPDDKNENGDTKAFTEWAATTNGLDDTSFVTFPNASVGANLYGSGVMKGIAGLRSYARFGYPSDVADNRNFLLGAEKVNDSTFGGAISVLDYPQFRSTRHTGVDTLTAAKLTQYLDTFYALHAPYGHSIDTLVARQGTIRAYFNNTLSQQYRDLSGGTPTLRNEGQPDVLIFNHMGRKIEVYTTWYQEKGTVHGYKRGGGNFRMITPPRAGSTTKPQGMPGFAPVHFWAKDVGWGGPTIPYIKNSRPTQGMEMPAECHCQIIPDQVAMMQLEGCAEDRTLSESAS